MAKSEKMVRNNNVVFPPFSYKTTLHIFVHRKEALAQRSPTYNMVFSR